MPKRYVPESAILNACYRWCYARKVFVWRNNTGAYRSEHGTYIRYGYPGSADLLGMTPSGRFLAIETKRQDGTLNDNQFRFQADVERNGGLYIVARSVDDLEARQQEILS